MWGPVHIQFSENKYNGNLKRKNKDEKNVLYYDCTLYEVSIYILY